MDLGKVSPMLTSSPPTRICVGGILVLDVCRVLGSLKGRRSPYPAVLPS